MLERSASLSRFASLQNVAQLPFEKETNFAEWAPLPRAIDWRRAHCRYQDRCTT